jgi:hypothetical protein
MDGSCGEREKERERDREGERGEEDKGVNGIHPCPGPLQHFSR